MWRNRSARLSMTLLVFRLDVFMRCRCLQQFLGLESLIPQIRIVCTTSYWLQRYWRDIVHSYQHTNGGVDRYRITFPVDDHEAFRLLISFSFCPIAHNLRVIAFEESWSRSRFSGVARGSAGSRTPTLTESFLYSLTDNRKCNINQMYIP